MVKSDNVVCMSFDDAYLFPALITLNSLQRTAPNLYSVIIINLDNSLKKASLDIIASWGEANGIGIEIRSIALDGQDLKVDERISKSAYGRIFAIQQLDSDFLYLDADLMAKPNWISIFENIGKDENSDKCLFASQEENKESTKTRNAARAISAERYFNSGVLLVRPSKIDIQEFENSIRYCLDNYSNLHFWAHDQDILNYIFSTRVTIINPEYNQDLWKNFQSSPKFLHFSGFFKPWKMSFGGMQIFRLLLVLMDLRNIRQEGALFYRTKGVIEYRKEMKRVSGFIKSHKLPDVSGQIQLNSRSLTAFAVLRKFIRFFLK